jgi:hypothetical protein
MEYIDKYGYPVETIKGRPVTNFIRRVIHTREVKFSKNIFNRTIKAFAVVVIIGLAIGLTIASLTV